MTRQRAVRFLTGLFGVLALTVTSTLVSAGPATAAGTKYFQVDGWGPAEVSTSQGTAFASAEPHVGDECLRFWHSGKPTAGRVCPNRGNVAAWVEKTSDSAGIKIVGNMRLRIYNGAATSRSHAQVWVLCHKRWSGGQEVIVDASLWTDTFGYVNGAGTGNGFESTFTVRTDTASACRVASLRIHYSATVHGEVLVYNQVFDYVRL